MLLQTAQGELPLLVFSLLVPLSLMAVALVACVRGFMPAREGGAELAEGKLDAALTLPIALAVAGIVAAVFHVGSPSHVLGVVSGVGRSPLSNEILVAGLSVVIAAVYWALCLAKHPRRAAVHKGFGVAMTVCAVLAAAFTGLAYSIPTIATWDGPYGWLGQLFLALLGGGALAACLLAVAGYAEARAGTLLLVSCGVVGALGVIAVVFAQGGMAGQAMSSSGVTLAASMGDYTAFAGVAAACAVVGVALWAFGALRGKARVVSTGVGCLAILVALVLVRIDFYGIFLSVGIM